jgi:hypothetical protein
MKYRDVRPGQIFRFADDEPDITYLETRSPRPRQRAITQIEGEGRGNHAITSDLDMDDHDVILIDDRAMKPIIR